MTSTAVAMTETRLPRPANVDPGQWQILCEVIFPHVRNARSIVLAVEYCRQRRLDIMKRPVNIVPMWSSELRKEVDTIWPSIIETEVTAARSGEWAGLDPPKLGPMKTETFSGTRKDRQSGGQVSAQVTLSYPEWAEVTVYRLKNGQRFAFTERVFWLESYGRLGGSILPNGTWEKRPIGQLIKVAKAAALRAAFPEEDSGTTDAEMDGGVIEQEIEQPRQHQQPQPEIIDSQAEEPQPSGEPRALEKTDEVKWPEWGATMIAAVRGADSNAAIDAWIAANKETLEAMQKEMPKMHSGLIHSINKHRLTMDATNG